MRAIISALAALAMAGCASVPTSNTSRIYDHKYNTTYVASSQSEFVGTSARVSAAKSAKPSWARFGHP